MGKFSRVLRAVMIAIIVAEVIAIFGILLHGHTVDVLAPRGMIADKQRSLILTSLLLMLIVVIPVFVMAFGFAWRYRDRGDEHKAAYKPDFAHNTKLEALWWGIPIILIGVLSVLAWNSSHSLDPFKPLVSDKKPVTIQVVALDWKWLFIYPEQNIATVNYVEFPAGTPINFEITSDAPMNSFWIPQLGGQVYAMSGMQTKLHLIADKPGLYNGSSANISGKGFAGMRFTAKSVSDEQFSDWLDQVRKSPDQLDKTSYTELAKPSENTPLAYYHSVQPELFEDVMMKYMVPAETKSEVGVE